MYKRKRKNDTREIPLESLYRPRRALWALLRSYAFGMIIAVFGVGAVSASQWIINTTSRAVLRSTQPSSLMNTAQIPAINPSLPTAQDAHMLFSLNSGEVFTLAGGRSHRVGLVGEDMATAGSGTLAFVRNGRLYIAQAWQAQPVEVARPSPYRAMLPAWSADGKVLTFVARAVDGDHVLRTTVGDHGLFRPAQLMTSAPQIVAPPLINPATGRVLIVEQIGVRQTAFYTIDPHCAGKAACDKTRRTIATVDQRVSYADYHPSAMHIVYSDRDDGQLYLLATSSGKVEPLAGRPNDGGMYKRRPVFSPDGAQLAYLGADSRLYVLRLSDDRLSVVPYAGITSADWVE